MSASSARMFISSSTMRIRPCGSMSSNNMPWPGSWGCKKRLEPRLQGRGLEAEGTGGALVANAAVAVDEVEAIGPRRVGGLGVVLHVVEERGDAQAQPGDAGAGHGHPLGQVPGVGEDHVLLEVAGH